MKASTNITHFHLTGEEGRRIIVLFSDNDVSARMLFADEWNKGREVELNRDELELLRAVLSTDSAEMRKDGAYLKLSDGDFNFTVRDTNRGEPYRQGFDFNVEQDWDGYPIFIELDECRDFARIIGKALGSALSPAPR